jgi:hypothetical protein
MEWQRHKTRAEMEHLTHHIYNSMEMDIHRDHSLSIGKKILTTMWEMMKWMMRVMQRGA